MMIQAFIIMYRITGKKRRGATVVKWVIISIKWKGRMSLQCIVYYTNIVYILVANKHQQSFGALLPFINAIIPVRMTIKK